MTEINKVLDKNDEQVSQLVALSLATFESQQWHSVYVLAYVCVITEILVNAICQTEPKTLEEKQEIAETVASHVRSVALQAAKIDGKINVEGDSK